MLNMMKVAINMVTFIFILILLAACDIINMYHYIRGNTVGKTYKLSMIAHIRSVLIKAFTITFIAVLFFAMTLGAPSLAFSLFNLVLIGSIIHEFSVAVTITVRMDGISVKRGTTARELKYETFYFSSAVHAKLVMEDRRTSRTETIACSGFDKKLFGDMMAQITRAQTEFFLRRSASGDFKSGSEIKQSARETANAAAKRNPYSKNYDSRKTAAQPEKVPEPKLQIDIPVIKPDRVQSASDEAGIRPVLESFDKEIRDGYNKMPEVTKVEDTAYRELPKIEKTEERKPIDKRAEDRTSFGKHEFHYPRREIIERCERANALTVLWGIFAIIAAFLLWYLAIGMYSGGALTGAGVILLLGTIVIASIIAVRASRTRGIFSKLEITDDFLIIDNMRYRFAHMTAKTVTPPLQDVGVRKLSFTYDGKHIEYSLGSAKQSADKRDIYNFSRYAELCRLLKIKGFQ